MTAIISRIVFIAAHNAVATRLLAWVKAHRFGLNVAAHGFLFAFSYGLSLLMLDVAFAPGEAWAIFETTVFFLVLVRLAVFWYHDLYEGLWVYVSTADVINIIRASGISTLAFALLGVFSEALRIPQRLLILDTFFCMMITYGVRLAARTIYDSILMQSEAFQGQEILLAGPLRRVQTLAVEMLADPLAYYKPAAVVDISEGKEDLRQRISDVPVLSLDEALSQKDRFGKIRHIVVCWPNASQKEFDQLVETLKPLGIPFTTLPYLDELLPMEPAVPQTARARLKQGAEDTKEQETAAQLVIRKRIYLSPPHMSGLEQEYVRRAFRSNFIAPLGPMVDAFEQEFSEKIGIPHAVALSSGTAAIHLALKNMGVGPGDTVIASTLTFIGSVTPILFQGATPIFVDADPKTWTMDTDLLEETLNRCAQSGRIPKAVLPTDLYGQCCDYGRLLKVCESFGIPLIVDAAEAMGATYNGRHAGNSVTAAIFSFNGNKIITTSGGGMLASHDRALVEQARFLSQQARDPYPHYEHSQLGYNYRMSNIVAAIGQGQLRVLEDRVRKKRDIFAAYHTALAGMPGITFMPEAPYGRCNRWLTVIVVDPKEFGTDRETLRLALEKENIESRPVWKPMHLQPLFEVDRDACAGKSRPRAVDHEQWTADRGPWTVGGQPTTTHGRQTYKAYCVGGGVSEKLFENGLCLPSGTAMSSEDLERVVEVVLRCRR